MWKNLGWTSTRGVGERTQKQEEEEREAVAGLAMGHRGMESTLIKRESFHEANEKLKELRAKAPLVLQIDPAKIDKLALLLRESVVVSRHRRRMHSYTSTFLGSDALELLLNNGVVCDATDGINVCRKLVERRILLRADRTRPIFNTTVSIVYPSFAEWRQRRKLEVHRENLNRFDPRYLYCFNVVSFARFRFRVRLIQARGLRLAKRNPLTGKYRERQINSLATVSIGSQIGNTLVINGEGDTPHWDFETELYVDHTTQSHQNLWIRVMDFRELGESVPIGTCAISVKQALLECSVGPDGSMPTMPKAWNSWHPLLPPVMSSRPEESLGGEVQVEIEVVRNVVWPPGLTVYDKLRGRRAKDFEAADDDEDEGDDASPRTPMDVGMPQDAPCREEGNAKPTRRGSDISRRGSLPKRKARGWRLCVRQITVRGVDADKSSDQKIWVEVQSAGRRRATTEALRTAGVLRMLLDIRANETGAYIGHVDVDGLPLSAAGTPNREARGKVVFSVWRQDIPQEEGGRKVLLPPQLVGRGTVQLRRVLAFNSLDEGVLMAGKDAYELGTAPCDDEDEEADDDIDADDETSSAVSGATAGSEVYNTMHGNVQANGEELDRWNSDDKQVHIVVLQRSAVLKRNVRKKTGELVLRVFMIPSDNMDGCSSGNKMQGLDGSLLGFNSGDLGDLDEEETVELGDVLSKLIDPDDTSDVAPTPMPAPLSNVFVDIPSIPVSVAKLASLLIGPDSKFNSAFHKLSNHTEIKETPWQVQGGSKAAFAEDTEEQGLPTAPTAASAVEADIGETYVNLATEGGKKLARKLTNAEVNDEERDISAANASANVDEGGAPYRTVEFMLPASSMIKAARCTNTEHVVHLSRGGFTVEAVSETPTVPYGDTFTTKTAISVIYKGPKCCSLRVSGEVVFRKSPGMVKGFIQNGAKKGMAANYELWQTTLMKYVTPIQKKTSRLKNAVPKELTPPKPAGSPVAWWALLRYFIVLALIIVAISIQLLTPDSNGVTKLEIIQGMVEDKLKEHFGSGDGAASTGPAGEL